MSAEPDQVERLLASISDGAEVDWDAERSASTPATRERVAIAAEVARIAAFHRELQREPEPPPAPERWGELLLLERIGSGARADVYRAWDPGLQREVALKLLRPGHDDAALLDEGRAAARVRHPHVVTVHGIATHEGRVGLWMELVRGVTLEREVNARGPLAIDEARRLAAEIGAGLAAVHAAHLRHRDVTPANLVRGADGSWVLADFGLGLRADDPAARVAEISGTPMYMAPELLASAPATERSDEYALGMVLWFALAGRHPFDAPSLAALTAAARRGPVPALGELRPDVPADLRALVARAIAPDPEARFPSVAAMVATAGSAAPVAAARSSRRGIPLGVAAVVIAIAINAAFWARRPRAPEPAPPPPAAATVPVPYSVGATLLRRTAQASTPLASGDRVHPGDRLSLEVRASVPVWAYVLNEDERGERTLLFPQSLLDQGNPLPADAPIVLPGPIAGRENAWTVTSAGGREHFLVVVSPEPVAEIEADRAHLAAPTPGHPVTGVRVGDSAVERLRGVSGLAPVPARRATPGPTGFDAFRALAGRETGVRGTWVRQIVLENPGR